MNIPQTGSVAATPQSTSLPSRSDVALIFGEFHAPLQGAEKTSPLSSSHSPSQEKDKKLNEQETQSLTEAANTELSSLTTALAFSIDKDINRYIVKLIDLNSQETLRQYPAEEMVEVYKALKRVTSLMLPEQQTQGASSPIGDIASGTLLSSKA